MNTYRREYYADDKTLGSLSVYNVGLELCDGGYQWGPGVRDHYLIHHVIRGEGIYVCDAGTYHLKAGDTFLIFPHTKVMYRAHETNPWEYAWVGFEGLDAKSIIRRTDFTREQPVLHQEAFSEVICRLIQNIYQVKGEGFSDAAAMTGACYSFLSFLMKHSQVGDAASSQQAEYVRKAVRYIEENYESPLTSEEIAAHIGISRGHLARVFREEMNQSPKEYFLKYRIALACERLEKTNLPVRDIAKSVGFDDCSYFSRIFRKYKNCPPTKYRETQKDTKETAAATEAPEPKRP